MCALALTCVLAFPFRDSPQCLLPPGRDSLGLWRQLLHCRIEASLGRDVKFLTAFLQFAYECFAKNLRFLLSHCKLGQTT